MFLVKQMSIFFSLFRYHNVSLSTCITNQMMTDGDTKSINTKNVNDFFFFKYAKNPKILNH